MPDASANGPISRWLSKGGKGGGFVIIPGGSSYSCPLVEEWLKEDLQLKDPYYNYGNSTPNNLICGAESGAICSRELSPEEDFEFSCTRCDLTYPDTEFCWDIHCSWNKCLENEVDTSTLEESSTLLESENATESSSALAKTRDSRSFDTVNVCHEDTRAEFLKVQTTSDGYCHLKSHQKMITRHFTAGVTNFRKVSLLMKKRQASGEPGMLSD